MAPRAEVIGQIADRLVAGRVGETVRLGLVAQGTADMSGIVPELVAAVRGRGSELTFSGGPGPNDDPSQPIFTFDPDREDELIFIGSDRPDWPTILIDVTGPDELELVRLGLD